MNAANFSAVTPARRSTEKVLLSLCAAVEPTLPAGAHLITTLARAAAREVLLAFTWRRGFWRPV